MGEQNNEHVENESQVYMCSNCGGNMEFDIKIQKLKCPYCGNEEEIYDSNKEIKEYSFDDVLKQEENSTWNEEVTVVKCENCGAETVADKNSTAVICSYCGSSHVLESKIAAGIKPEGIIPFKKDKNDARLLFEKWIKSRWLAPNALKHLYQSDKMMSIYVPYWTYDTETYNTYTAQGGKHYYVTVERDGKKQTVQKTRWYPVSGRFSHFFDDVLVNGSKNFNDNIMLKIEPFNTSQVEPYRPEYISGFTAERYSRGVKDGFEIAKGKMEDVLVNEVSSIVRRRYDVVSGINVNTSYSDVTYKHVLFPVWTARYDFNGKEYRYIINAQTGRVSGTSPISPVKVSILVIIIIAIIILVLYFSGAFSGGSSSEYAYNNIFIILEMI
ncbi:MAG: hypothetical protein ACERKV_13555 [Clostridiaceae bacterium]